MVFSKRLRNFNGRLELFGPPGFFVITPSGMDWSLGGSALLAAHSALLDVESPSDSYRSAMTALAYVESDPVYVVNGSLYQQAEYGTCQTGSSWTTWVDNLPRKYDLN